jgi:oligopeptide/dipeptide ABC transporter ATP-binding protein
VTNEPLLEVRDLSVRFQTVDGVVNAVDGLSFTVDRGESLGVVGESGSGKSVTFMAIMGLLNRSYTQIEGEVRFRGHDLLNVSPGDLRSIRGAGIGMVFQDPMTSLHPLYRVGSQIVEAIRAHRDISKDAAWSEAVDILRLVGIPSAEERIRAYPHELSGGMRQRVMIAMALVLKPDLLIADEPTTALDVTVQAQILELIEDLKRELNIGVVLISHSLGVIADVCQRVMVMYAGRAVELGTRDEVFHSPTHPYTWGLLESIPRVGAEHDRLVPIIGSPPSLIHLPPGCPFHPRCPHKFESCDKERPELADRGTGHLDACHLSAEEKVAKWSARRAQRTQVPA